MDSVFHPLNKQNPMVYLTWNFVAGSNLTFIILQAPSRGPENVHVELLQHNRILVMWDAISSEAANGQLRGYTVYIKDYHNHDPESATKSNVSSSETQIVIGHLDGGRKYTVAVTAFTVEEGPHSEWQEFIVGTFG